MPQADLVTFHLLTIWTNVLILITFNLSYYFAVPFISVIFKIAIKNNNKKLFFLKMLKIKSLIIIKKTSFALTTQSYNHAKRNSRNPLITIIKQSIHTSSNRIFLESNKNAPVNFKKSLISILKRGIKTSKKKKKSFIKNVNKTILINTDEKSTHLIYIYLYNIAISILPGGLFAILLVIVYLPIELFLNSLDWCDLFLKELNNFSGQYSPKYSGIDQYNLECIKNCQTWLVDSALESMLNNEFYFKFHPNTTSCQNYKIVYQEGLKIFLEKLDLERFENSDEALRFISFFYQHYFKIADLNKTLIISQNLRK